MVIGNWSSLLIIKRKSPCAGRASMQVANGTIEVVSGQASYLLLINLSEEQAYIPKHTFLEQTPTWPGLFAPTEATLLEPKLHTICVMHYNPSVYRNIEISHHKALEKHDDEKLNIIRNTKSSYRRINGLLRQASRDTHRIAINLGQMLEESKHC